MKQLPEQKNNEKKIIGYNLIKPEYKQAVLIITGLPALDAAKKGYDIYSSGSCVKPLQKAGVLDLWFSPVFSAENEYKVGEHIYFKKVIEDKSPVGTVGKITKYQKEGDYDWLYYTNLTTGFEGGFQIKAFKDSFRKATEAEIEASKIKLPEINGVKPTYKDGIIKYGCAEFDNLFWTGLWGGMNPVIDNVTNRKIVEVTLCSGVKITKDHCKQVVDFIENN